MVNAVWRFHLLITVNGQCPFTSSSRAARYSPSRVLTATGLKLSVRKGQILNPYRYSLTDRQNVCHRWLHRRPLHVCQICCNYVHGVLLCKWVNITTIYFYLFTYSLTDLLTYLYPLFGKLPTSQTPFAEFRVGRLRRPGITQGCAFGLYKNCSLYTVLTATDRKPQIT